MELNGDIFVNEEFLFIKRNKQLFKYDKQSLKRLSVVDSEYTHFTHAGDKIYCRKGNEIVVVDDLMDTNSAKAVGNCSDCSILNFYFHENVLFVVTDDLKVLKNGEIFIKFQNATHKFHKNFIYFQRNKSLIKRNLLNGEEQTIKSNVDINILKVYDDILVFITNSAIVNIVSDTINLTFHKHSAPIASVKRVDDYLYFVSRDNKLSVAEIKRENRRFLLTFIGDFKKMVAKDDLIFILTDIELVVFNVVKNKTQSHTFLMPPCDKLIKIRPIEDEYYQAIALAYKEKKVKREIEPFYRLLNENTYKIEERTYALSDCISTLEEATDEYALCYKNTFFVVDLKSMAILKVYKFVGLKIYFSNGYLINLKKITKDKQNLEIYKLCKDKLIYIKTKEMSFSEDPKEIIFYNDTIFYLINDKLYKTSIVIDSIELLDGVRFITEGIAVTSSAAYSVLEEKVVFEGPQITFVRVAGDKLFVIVQQKKCVEVGGKEVFRATEGKLIDYLPGRDCVLSQSKGKKWLVKRNQKIDVPSIALSLINEDLILLEGGLIYEIN